jgi:hypothetical protein
MGFRAATLLPIVLLACGCAALDPPAATPQPLASVKISIPAAPSRLPSSTNKAMPTFARAGGLAELVVTQREVARGAKGAGTLSLSRKLLKSDMDNILDAVQKGRLDAIPADLGIDPAEAPNLAWFLRIYFGAYFRDFQVINTSGDEAKFFYNRAGQKFGFPAITVSVSAEAPKLIEVTRIDELALIGDLTRVAIEAIGDSLTPGVPADAASTGCVMGLLKVCRPSTDKQLRCIVKAADIAEAVVAFAAAHAVRGVSVLALNNEALAKSVQVAFSVSARKGAEEGAAAGNLCPEGGGSAGMPTTTLTVQLVD